MRLKHELSKKLFAESLKYVPGGVHSPVRAFKAVGGEPFFARKAAGPRVWDVDDNEYIDYVCSWGASILGHTHPAILNALKQVMKEGISFGISNPHEIRLAKLICANVPSVEKVRFCNSGTEATMSAIRLARGFTGRDKIVKFEGCYHGHVDSLLVKAGSGALSAGVPAALAALTLTLPFNRPELIKDLMRQQGKEVAAIILEPVPANAGLYLPEPGFLELLRQLSNEYGCVLIFDEVMTGFRLARGGAQEVYGVRPDLSCFGKVIGGGLPVGAFGGRADIMDYLAPLGPVYQAGTLSGNPLAMVAGLTNLEHIFGPENAPDKSRNYRILEEMTSDLALGLAEIAKKNKIPFCGKQIGSLFCGYFTSVDVKNLDDARTSDTATFAKFFHGMLDRGVYFAPSQFEAGFVSFAHTDAEIGQTLRIAEDVMAKI